MSSSLKPVVTAPTSLLSNSAIKQVPTVRVYFQHESRLYRVNIQVQGLTTSSLIAQSVQKLNQNKELSLLNNSAQYQLYAARKDGSRDNGLPALEPNQSVMKTQIKRFHLVPLLKVQSFYVPMPTKDTISSIKSEIDINVTSKGQAGEKEENKGFNFCNIFCLGKQK